MWHDWILGPVCAAAAVLPMLIGSVELWEMVWALRRGQRTRATVVVIWACLFLLGYTLFMLASSMAVEIFGGALFAAFFVLGGCAVGAFAAFLPKRSGRPWRQFSAYGASLAAGIVALVYLGVRTDWQ